MSCCMCQFPSELQEIESLLFDDNEVLINISIFYGCFSIFGYIQQISTSEKVEVKKQKRVVESF